MMQNPGVKQKMIMFFPLVKVIRTLMLTFCLISFFSNEGIAQTETLNTGSYIINMGIVPQTQSNALKPYGLVYDLLKNYNVQVKWVINQTKVKDGADFTYNGIQYKGGTFIIPAQYRTAAVNNRITFFGVTGTTTTSPLTVNVTHTLTTAPRWTLDFQNGGIAADFFVDAGIPASAYDTKTPAQLNSCDEIYVMPHADADWSYYGPLRNWILNNRGSFWGGCRTGSQIENLYNPAAPSEQMNFLSTNIGAAGNALIPHDSHDDGTPPYIHQFPTSPVAQYMGISDDAHDNGSERIYLPVLNGAWRPTTKVVAYDPTQSNVPANSPGPASVIVYGRAYGNPSSGLVMYEGGHNIGGTGTQEIAAQRAFWNFSFLSSTEVLPGGCVGSIGDFVWLDANGNGIQDNGETGIQGVQVTLTRPDLSTATTVTNASGFYQFGNLAAGTYKITFPTALAGGYALTSQNVGSDDSKDSDPDQGTGMVNGIVIGPGQNDNTVDAGYVIANLTLGNTVFFDANRSGIFDAGDGTIGNATVRLYKDNNNDNNADGPAIATTTTDPAGIYSFANLAAGNYIVGVEKPVNYAITVVNGGDPDNDIDNDNNATMLVGNEARGMSITLISGNEPTGGNTNNTYDIGFYDPRLPPNGGQSCFIGVNPQVYAKSFWNVNVNSQTVTMRVTFSKNFVDNCYKASGNADNWNRSHTFGNLLGSDHLQWSLKNGNGTEVLKFKQDYISANDSGYNYPSGYGTLGFSGDGGTPSPGSATDVLSFRTSLSTNFNDFGYVLIDNSPATDTNYTPNPAAPNWIYETWYEVTVKASAFGASGFGFVDVSSVHASPSKTGNNTEIITNIPCSGSIGDRVWYDTDQDGIQDAGEVGVAGVTLVLLNGAGQPIAATTTDAFGIYKFSGLASGNYFVRITPPANYSLSPKFQGGDTNLDSDFDLVSYTTGTIALAGGQNRTDIDAGLNFTQVVPASVGDRVWLDNNGDGVQDAGEKGVSNVLVTLYNSSGDPVRYTYTDVNGFYLFTNVTPGNYTVGVSLPPAFVFSPNNGPVSGATNSDINPATGRTATFTVNTGDQIRYVDAGLKTQLNTNASVGDYVWNDLNKNGIQEAGEPGISDVTVNLVNAGTNAVVATQLTDVTGKYMFNDVTPGDYLVQFIQPGGYTTTTKLNNNVSVSGTDSDVDPATAKTAVFTLAAGERITSVDAGYWVTTGGTGKIGDRVWHDANQNGIQDVGEKNVQGVTVILYNAANVPVNQMVTDASGNYLFTDLPAGNYTVEFINIPSGFTFTSTGFGTAATGSDANPATGKTSIIVLGAGETNLDIDAGIRSVMAGTASIGNRVWYDLNNNGLQDAGEPGVQGSTVELLDAAGNPVDKDPNTPGIQPTTTLTNALGEYLFTGLPAGDYKVRFGTLPVGYNVVTKNVGTNRELDSDGNPLSGGKSTTDVLGVAVGEERLDIDLGLFNPTAPLGQLGDYVWFDANINGVQDSGEQGVPGVTVTLLNGSNTSIATAVTDGEGKYKFANLANGTYSVKFSNLPAGFNFSSKDLGGNDALDSDADPASGITGTYTISAGASNMTVDAGIYSGRAALGDYVWFDANSDGIQDVNEKGIAGITVFLYDAGNVLVTSAVTDQSGRYFFSNLNPGTYTVGFATIPDKLVFTTKDNPVAGDLADSDVDPATGRTGSYTLIAGQVNLSVDAGLKPFIPASVGDYVWFDIDRDGIQDANEPPVPGILVTLYDAANQPVGTAITDGDGKYLISNVPAGTGYYVIFGNKPDASAPWTLQNVGGAGASDNSKADATGKTDPFDVGEGQNVTNVDAGLHRFISLSGNVWHDENGMSDNLVNKTSAVPIPNGLRVYLVNFSTGAVVESIKGVPANTGKFQFDNININTNYRLYLTTQVFAIGSVIPAFGFNTLPGEWHNTGEHLGITPGSDGIPNGWLNVVVGGLSVTNANFGIKEGGGNSQQ